MAQRIAHVTLVVRNYDEAIAFYTQKLGFEVVEDVAQGDGKRWVVIAPANSPSTSLLLAQAASDEQLQAVGNQAGGRVFLFLHTSTFWDDYHRMKAQGVTFLEEPRQEPYGDVVVFQDCYGNKWDLLGPKPA
ncbi:VOC family protein [Hymenobacter jejuensis]|nr:VOC family protein [Hymenobacter jejuensis]